MLALLSDVLMVAWSQVPCQLEVRPSVLFMWAEKWILPGLESMF